MDRSISTEIEPAESQTPTDLVRRRTWFQPAALAISTVTIIIGGLLATTFAQSPIPRGGVNLPGLPPSAPRDQGTSGFVEFQMENEFIPPIPTPPQPAKASASGFVTIADQPQTKPEQQSLPPIPKSAVPRMPSVPINNINYERPSMPAIPKPVSVPTVPVQLQPKAEAPAPLPAIPDVKAISHFAEQDKGKDQPPQVDLKEPPQPVEPSGPVIRRFPHLGGPPFGIPQPTKKDLEEINKFVGPIVDPKAVLELALGRGRIIILKDTPKRVQVVDETIAQYNLVTPKEITIVGKKIGTTNLNIWFADPNDPAKEKIIGYLVRVSPDPDARDRLEKAFKELEREINAAFPNSLIRLVLVGNKVMVTGQAHDIVDATMILRIVRAHVSHDDSTKYASETASSLLRSSFGMPQFGLDQYHYLASANVINMLRIPGEQQVMLRVTVAEVNRSAARSIGVNFNFNGKTGNFVGNNTGNIATGGSSLFTSFTSLASTGTTTGGLSTNNIPLALDNGQLHIAINALRNLNYARSLAEPNLVALNGQTATFHAGGEFPVPVTTGFTSGGLQGVNFVPFGVTLNFTPFITDRDRVRLQMSGVVSTRDSTQATNIGGANVPGLDTRNFQTTVELREGETLAIAGLIQNNLGMDANRIPGIGDLPILNWLTGFQRMFAAEQELVVLITPEFVHPMKPKEVPPLPGSDLFEPSDCEFFLAGRLESRREYDYRSPVMTDIARMRRYHRCEQIYMFGPHGHVGTNLAPAPK
jgi:pilus assembly protein CpaC